MALRVWRGRYRSSGTSGSFGNIWERKGGEGDVDSVENCRSKNTWDKAEASDSYWGPAL